MTAPPAAASETSVRRIQLGDTESLERGWASCYWPITSTVESVLKGPRMDSF